MDGPRPKIGGPGVVRDDQGRPYPHQHDYEWDDSRRLWVCTICQETKHILTTVPER
jgi:hypothetical protein